MSDDILCVDDEPTVLSGLRRQLHNRFKLDVATSATEALARIAARPYAVLVSDAVMPGMDGVELLRRVQRLSPNTVRLMLTGRADLTLAIRAVHEDAVFRFLTKPCPAEDLVVALDAAMRQHRLITAEKELLEKTLNGSLSVLTDILSVVAPEAFGRAQVIRAAISSFASHLGVPDVYRYELAAMLAPIGLVTLPPAILAARGSGDVAPNERKLLARVPEMGAELLARIPRLEAVAEIVRFQAKGFDGSGPPESEVTGAQVPLGARMLKLIDDRQRLLDQGVWGPQLLAALRANRSSYDPKLLAALPACFRDGPPVLSAPEGRVHVASLRPGDVLAAPVTTREGQLLLAAGHAVTEAMRLRLLNYAEVGAVEPVVRVRTLVPSAGDGG